MGFRTVNAVVYLKLLEERKAFVSKQERLVRKERVDCTWRWQDTVKLVDPFAFAVGGRTGGCAITWGADVFVRFPGGGVGSSKLTINCRSWRLATNELFVPGKVSTWVRYEVLFFAFVVDNRFKPEREVNQRVDESKVRVVLVQVLKRKSVRACFF